MLTVIVILVAEGLPETIPGLLQIVKSVPVNEKESGSIREALPAGVPGTTRITLIEEPWSR